MFCLSCASVQEMPTQKVVTKEYEWRQLSNYSELRKKIGWSDNYADVCRFGRPISKMTESMNNEQWSMAASIGDLWLKQCPIDIRVHYFAAISLEKLDREDEAESHFRWMKGLMDDLVASGDGKSAKSAYEVISISEEYDALYLFGLEKKSQSLISGEVTCDLITATDENGKEVSIYFNPAAHFVRLAKMFK